MPADASIFGQIQPVRPRNMLADFANVAQIQGLQQNQQLGAMKMDELRRARSQEEALAGAYRNALAPDGTINRNALFSGVAGAGLGHKLPGIQESFAKSDKAKVEAEKERLALAREKVGFVGQLLGSVKDQATYDAARATAQANGLPVDNMPPQYDPAFIEAKRQETLTVAQQLEQKWKAMEFTTPNANARLQAETSTANNQRSVAASKENAAATRAVADATREAATVKDKRDVEMKLADDYRAQSKPFKEVSDAHRTIITALDKATTSPAATLAGATKFMKLLDPGSVVRESELGMALAASGVFDRALNYANVLQRGKVLTPTQAQDFKTIANQIYAAAQQQQQSIDANYRKQATTYGLRPDMVIQDLGQNRAVQAASTGRESSGQVAEGPSVFDQADAILRGGK